MRRLLLRLLNVLRHSGAERDLAREIDAHLRILEDEYREQGMSASDARVAARKAMGGVELTKEVQRDTRSFRWLDDLRQDIRYAFRSFAKTPGFTATAIVTLALGIGANTAMYSAIDAVYLRPLPFPDPDRLVQVPSISVEIADPDAPAGIRARGRWLELELPDLYGVRDLLSHSAAYAMGSINVGTGPEPRHVNATFVTTEFFETLGRQATFGRTFTLEETSPGGANVVVLSYRFWVSQFNGDSTIVGQPIVVNGLTHEVVGVMPEDFRFPAQAQLWLPMTVPAPVSIMWTFRHSFPVAAIARLAAGVPMPVASERLRVIRDSRGNAAPNQGEPRPGVRPLQGTLVGQGTPDVVILAAAAGFVLLIACANLANLFLSRAVVRRREIALRSVLGATRGRIIRQLLIECTAVSLAGAAVGLLVVTSSLSALTPLVPASLEGLTPLRVDWRVLGFSVVLATMVAVGFGLWPALSLSRAKPGEAIRDESGGVGRGHTRATGALVVVEAALACMLLSGAGLALDNLRRSLSADLGMEIEPVVSARLTFPQPVYPDAASLRNFVEAVVARVARAPGVEQAATINTLPFTDEERLGIRVSAESDSRPMDDRPMSSYVIVSPGYFKTMGIPLLSGRDFSWTDGLLTSVVVVNRAMAQDLWPDQNPLGKRLTIPGFEPRTVVGVVGDARMAPGDDEIGPQVYLPIQEQPQAYMSIVARGAPGTEATALLSHIQTAVRAVDSAMPVYAAQSMESVVASSVARQRTGTRFISLFGAMAVGLAAVGVYGVLAYAVARGTREIGVRMALGATSGQVIYSVMVRGLLLVGFGAAVGAGVAVGMRQFLGSVLEELVEASPAVYVVPPLVLLLVTLVAVWIPARRAARVDPLIALRTE